MNNIRKIIADKIANLKDKRVNDYADGFNDGLFQAFKVFLEEIPAPRTEADILKDFEWLGLVIAKNDDFELILIDDCDRMIAIYKTLKRYACYYFSEGYKPLQLSTDITMQEHKLLNELFICWGWL